MVKFTKTDGGSFCLTVKSQNELSVMKVGDPEQIANFKENQFSLCSWADLESGSFVIASRVHDARGDHLYDNVVKFGPSTFLFLSDDDFQEFKAIINAT